MTSVDLSEPGVSVSAESQNAVVRSDSTRRLDFIDALRGFACLLVLVCHTFAANPTRPGLIHLPFKLLVLVADIGWLGVSLFLVLSGFCLYYPLVCKKPDLAISLDLRSYALRRCLRILPPYYAVVIGLVALGLIGAHFPEHSPIHALAGLGAFLSIGDIFAHIFMVYNLNPHTIFTVNGAFWSLALEFQLYILFPLLILLAGRRGLRSTLLVTFLISLAWQIGVYRHLGIHRTLNPWLACWYDALPARGFEFAAGMTVAALVARQQTRWRKPALLILLALVLPSSYFVLKIAYFSPLLTQVWGVIFACLILWTSGIPEVRFRDSFAWRMLVKLGVISYTAYLIHVPVFMVINPDRIHLDYSREPILLGFGLVRMLIVVGVSVLVYQVIEAPFIRMGKAVGRRNRIASEGRKEANVL